MANLPPPNHVADLPEDDPEEQPKLAPEPGPLKDFALYQNRQPVGNMMDGYSMMMRRREKGQDHRVEEEMEEENDDDDAEVINPYEEADPLNLPPPDLDTESEDMVVAPTPDDHEQEAKADTVGTITRVPYSVRPFSGTVYVGSGPSWQVFALGPTRRDVNTLHRQTWSFEVRVALQSSRHYRERPYVAPTTPVAQVDRADPDDPSPPRHDDPYVIVRDAATRNEGDDAATTSDPQPSHPPGSPSLSQDRATRGNTNGAGGPGGNTGGNTGGQGGAPPARECTYSSFMKCNPTSFLGNEGAVELCHWFEKTESVLSIRECAERNKIPIISGYTQRFNELVLLCPEMVPSEKKKVEAYLRGLPKNIKGETTSSRPVVLNEAV
ncbi:hypothetical protein Tco_0513763 [Tanacetum coccineum]